MDEIEKPAELIHHGVEIWIVDDDTAIGYALKRGLRYAGGTDSRVEVFETALAAFTEIDRRSTNGEPLPDIVFIDGNLAKDAGEWKQGRYLVAQIKAKQNIKSPMLVAHSSDRKVNEEMGADTIVNKPNFIKSTEIIETVAEQKRQTE